MVANLVLSVLGSLIAAAILFAVGRLSQRGGELPPASALPSIHPSAPLLHTLALAAGFVSIGVTINLFQPPASLVPLIAVSPSFVGYHDLRFEAEEIRRRTLTDAQDAILDAQGDAEALMLHASRIDSSLRAAGQSRAADALLEIASSQANEVNAVGARHAEALQRGGGEMAATLEARAAGSYGSLRDLLPGVASSLRRMGGTLLRTLTIALFLAAFVSRRVRITFLRPHFVAVCALAVGAAALSLLGAGLIPEIIAPFLIGGVVASPASGASTWIDLIRSSFVHLQRHFGVMLIAIAAQLAVVLMPFGLLWGSDYYYSALIGPILGLEVGRVAVGTFYLHRLLRPPVQAQLTTAIP